MSLAIGVTEFYTPKSVFVASTGSMLGPTSTDDQMPSHDGLSGRFA